jgi:SAM-dependent methyltransferase
LVSGGRWRDWQRTALDHVVGSRVLEIGCGPGHLLHDLVAAGHSAYGVDLSPCMWTRAQRELARAGKPDAVLASDARALPFGSGSFDSIVMTFPTQVVRDPRLWNEAARLVRPGGRFVVVLGARRRDHPPNVDEAAVDLPIPVDLFRYRSFLERRPSGCAHLVVADRVEGAPFTETAR